MTWGRVAMWEADNAYASEWSPSRADQHLLRIEVAANRLIDHPELGRTRNELITGMRSVTVGPHIVFYRVSGHAIEIVRVLHQQADVSAAFPRK